MRLNKTQKELLFQWIAEGIKPGEINKRAAKEADPFVVTRQQVEYYRKQCAVAIEEITKQGEFQALNTGLAVSSERVQVLKDVAALLIKDLLEDGKLWLTRTKSVGGGLNFFSFTEEEFNKAEIEALRGLLDDIAKEIGDRSIKTDITSDRDGEYRITFVSEQTRESDGA